MTVRYMNLGVLRKKKKEKEKSSDSLSATKGILIIYCT